MMFLITKLMCLKVFLITPPIIPNHIRATFCMWLMTFYIKKEAAIRTIFIY